LAGVASPRALAAEASPPSQAAADETPIDQPYEIGIFGGLHFYDKQSGLGRYVGSPEGYSPDLGGAFGLRLTYNIIPWVGVELEAMISPTHTRFNDANGGTRQIIVGYRGQVIGNFIHTGYVRPFALVGWGALSEISHSHPGPYGVPFNDTDDVFHLGVGSKFPLVDYFGLRLDGRIMFPPAAFVSGPGSGERYYHGPDYEILVSAYLAFGGNRPLPPPAPLPPPPPPPKDTDGDGIPDNIDKCPNEPETFNGYQDEDGCPDEVPAALKKFTGVIEGITFKTNSANLTKKSYDVLDRAVQVLSDYPDTRIEISGHTDNVGKDEYNKELSQKRADAVKEYFVNKGIRTERLTAIGYGPEKPIADNKTKAGKAKNRRTEFKLVTGN
jgi:outer membrane protein OmpA-like peptidoglycan-associated protein